MNMAVEPASGPFSIVETSLPIWLSPTIIESPLCWLVLPLAPAGIKIEKLGSVPRSASLKNRGSSCRLLCCGPFRHSAKVGQIAHL